MLNKLAVSASLMALMSCGVVYIPQNFKHSSSGYGYHRTDHIDIEVIPLTFLSVQAANADGYTPLALPDALLENEPTNFISTRARIEQLGLDKVDPARQFDPLPSPPNIYVPNEQILPPQQKQEGLSSPAGLTSVGGALNSLPGDGAAVPLYAMSRPVTPAYPTPPLMPPRAAERVSLNPPPQLRSEPYRIGPGDVISLLSSLQSIDANQSDPSTLVDAAKRLRVQGDGEIFIPQAGAVDVGGLTLSEARRVIFDRLIENDLDFDFGVEISEFNNQNVAVSGLSGAQLLPITVRPLTLAEAITAAGGLGSDPSNTVVRVVRDGTIYELPGTNLLSTNSYGGRLLQNGDAVSISLIRNTDQALAFFQQQLQLMSLDQGAKDRERSLNQEILAQARAEEEIRIANQASRQAYLDRLRDLRDSNSAALRSIEQERRATLLANDAERARERAERRALLELELQEERTRLEQEADQRAQSRELFQQQLALDAIERDYVTIAGEVGSQTTFVLPFGRPVTLNRILFEVGGGLPVTTGDPSEIYIIRRPVPGAKIEHLVAYHLDASNAVNLAMTTAFEMRPNDIVFVNSQPVADWNRAINQILPSTGFLGTVTGTVTRLGGS